MFHSKFPILSLDATQDLSSMLASARTAFGKPFFEVIATSSW
jgi:hypothetical protein